MANRSRMLNLDVEGMPELLAKIRSIAPKLERRELKKAVSAATQVVLKASRHLAPWGNGLAPGGRPRQHLRWSLDKKVKQYRKAAVGVTGPRYREAPHSHLVHDGTRPHKIFLPAGKAIRLKNATIYGPRYLQHPGSKANPFMMRAWQSSRAVCLNVMQGSLRKFFANLDKENANLYGGG